MRLRSQEVADAARLLASDIVLRKKARLPQRVAALGRAAFADHAISEDDLHAVQELLAVCNAARVAGFDPEFWLRVIALILQIVEMFAAAGEPALASESDPG